MSIDPGPAPETPLRAKPPARRVELLAMLALTLAMIIAITAVSIGIARANGLAVSTDSLTAPLAIALFIGALLAAMGGLTAIMADKPRKRP